MLALPTQDRWTDELVGKKKVFFGQRGTVEFLAIPNMWSQIDCWTHAGVFLSLSTQLSPTHNEYKPIGGPNILELFFLALLLRLAGWAALGWPKCGVMTQS
jgi:hypothetical protein